MVFATISLSRARTDTGLGAQIGCSIWVYVLQRARASIIAGSMYGHIRSPRLAGRHRSTESRQGLYQLQLRGFSRSIGPVYVQGTNAGMSRVGASTVPELLFLRSIVSPAGMAQLPRHSYQCFNSPFQARWRSSPRPAHQELCYVRPVLRVLSGSADSRADGV